MMTSASAHLSSFSPLRSSISQFQSGKIISPPLTFCILHFFTFFLHLQQKEKPFHPQIMCISLPHHTTQVNMLPAAAAVANMMTSLSNFGPWAWCSWWWHCRHRPFTTTPHHTTPSIPFPSISFFVFKRILSLLFLTALFFFFTACTPAFSLFSFTHLFLSFSLSFCTLHLKQHIPLSLLSPSLLPRINLE